MITFPGLPPMGALAPYKKRTAGCMQQTAAVRKNDAVNGLFTTAIRKEG
jgi:hypothetical protein